MEEDEEKEKGNQAAGIKQPSSQGKHLGVSPTEHGRRSKSPESDDESTSGRKFSRPKPIVRTIPKSPTTSTTSITTTAAATTTTATTSGDNSSKMASPKRSVVQPPSGNLSSISEEDGGGSSPEQGRTSEPPRTTVSMGRLPSDSSSEASLVFGGGVDGAEEEMRQSRRRATLSMSDFKKKSLSEDKTSDTEVAGGDTFESEKTTHLDSLRSRTSTISSSHRSSYQKEHKRRKNSKQLKQEAAKLAERSPDFFTGRKQRIELLLDPDLELRIRETISSEIGKKYGGLRRANKAATVIQSAYRQYKLHETYNKIRLEATEVRKRAQSLKNPRRNHSMVRRNRPIRYNRNISALAPSTDPLLKAKLLSQDIGRAGLSHTSSRHELIERARKERSLSEGRRAGGDPASPVSAEDIISARHSVSWRDLLYIVLVLPESPLFGDTYTYVP